MSKAINFKIIIINQWITISLLPEKIAFLGNRSQNYSPRAVVQAIDLIIVTALASRKLESTWSKSIKINYQEISSTKRKHTVATTSSISSNSTQNPSKIILLIKKHSQKDYIILPKKPPSLASLKNTLNKPKIFRILTASSTIVNSKQEMTLKEMLFLHNLPEN